MSPFPSDPLPLERHARLRDLAPGTPFASLRQARVLVPALEAEQTGRGGCPLLRDAYVRQHGYAVLSAELLLQLSQLLAGERVLEVGAGSGYLSQCLADRGVDITASELGGATLRASGIGRVIRRDHAGNSLELLPGPWTVVLMVWPMEDNGFAGEVVRCLQPGQTLVFLGEARGGCTADDAFFEELGRPCWAPRADAAAALNAWHLSFRGFQDRWALWQRTP